jgi:uracil-DNA glycosylase
MYTYEKVTNRIHPDWMPFFEINKDELISILNKINNEIESNIIIYPRQKDLFRALYYHSPNDIKLIILGQDPYINEENNIPQAMGLCFSVPRSISENRSNKIPPSLKNIYKEINNSYPDYNIPNHGLLKKWARKEKILLLNSSLTVIKGKSNSHANLWITFTDKLIKWFQDINNNSIFLLMGNFAKNKQKIIDNSKHKIFITVHPSPLSAYNGFFGCNVFKLINDCLIQNNKEPIKW